jgi:hypothetical protein
MGAKVSIVTFFDRRFAALGTLTASFARKYAERHGYRFRAFEQPLLPNRRHIYWNKIAVLLAELKYADHTLWIDADVLVVGNQSLDEIGTGDELVVSVYACGEPHGSDAGVRV